MKILSKLLGAASAAVILAAVPAFVPSLSPVVTASAANEAGALLSGKDKELYDELKTFVTEIANGTRTDTVFKRKLDDLYPGGVFKSEWTAADLQNLGITITDNIIDQSAFDSFVNRISDFYSYYDTNYNNAYNALIPDCAYELYWLDKTVNSSHSSSMPAIGLNNNIITLAAEPDFSITFTVSTDYGSGTTFDSSKASRAASAKSTALGVVSTNSSKSDYDKLKAYSDYICGAVDYDSAAAANSSTPYGDPWQMINVFDGNSSTNVVCEGYSKAFKYLCDNSSWSSSVNCYLVTGQMAGGTGAGPHMWNIVTIGSNAYLVDVTNSDGLPSGSTPLFLRGGKPLGDSYTFSRGGSDNLTFTYDSDTTSLWSSGILTLATSDYEVPAELEIKHSLTLGDDIGVNFYVKNWTDADAYMTFTVNGKNTRADAAVDKTGMQKFTCTVNSLEMGMDISAVYHYSGGTKSETYSVSQYINEVNANPSNFDAATVKLANATADYGHYVQQYLFELHPGISGNYTAMSNKNNLDSSDISNAIKGLSLENYNLIRDSSGSDIENVTFSLYLDAKTSIYLYLNPAEGYTGTPTVSDYSVENVGGKYRIVVPGLGAYQLGTIKSVTVTANGSFTISNISAYAYAKLILNSGTTSDKAKYAMAALYNYCEAAKDYRTAHSS